MPMEKYILIFPNILRIIPDYKKFCLKINLCKVTDG